MSMSGLSFDETPAPPTVVWSGGVAFQVGAGYLYPVQNMESLVIWALVMAAPLE